MDIWNILGVIAIIALLTSFVIGKNAIWKALTAGAVIGLIIWLIVGFSWLLYKRILIVSVLVGAFAELARRLTPRKKIMNNNASDQYLK
jgi:uncharacterized membrane protein